MKNKNLDIFAGSAAFLCMIHCMALPILAILAPFTLVAIGGFSDQIEMWLYGLGVAFAIPAVWLGHKAHKKWHPMAMIAAGLGIMYLVNLFAHDHIHNHDHHDIEFGWPLMIKIIGGLVLITGHYINHRLCKNCNNCSITK
jgi:hypothetical protein